MTTLLIIAVFAASAFVLLLLCAILRSLFELEKLLVRLLEDDGQIECPDSKSYFSHGDTLSEEEERRKLEQKRWDEGIANLLSYMGKPKDGEKSE